MRTALVLALAVAGVVSAADAFSARLDVSAAEDVALRGDLVASADGALHARGARTTGHLRLALDDARIVVWTREAAYVPAAEARQWLRPPTATEIEAERAVVDVALAGERYDVAVAVDDGRVSVAGTVDEVGRPRFLATGAADGVGFDDGPPAWSWEAGWLHVGRDDAYVPGRGFPDVEADTAAVAGTARVQAFGGNATVVADGEASTWRLGVFAREDASATVPGDPVVVFRRLVVEGRVVDGEVPLGDSWGLAGPSPSWQLDGEIAFRDADGAVSSEDGVRTFAGADLAGEGRVTFVPAFGAALRPAAGDAVGSWSALRLDGAAVAPASSVARAPVAAAAGVVLLVAVAAALLLYTRILPDEVLDNETRRRIYQAAVLHPGLHKRDLHRKVGGSWSAFGFHVRVLDRAGCLRLVRHGRYALVFPRGGADVLLARAVPHPLQREVYEALPPDGRSVPFKDLRERVDVSRQLLAYHVRQLAGRGLVEVARGARGLVVSRRLTSGDAPARSARPGA